MPTTRKGDSAQAAIALVEGALQASKPSPVKTEPPTEPVASILLAAPPVVGRAWSREGLPAVPRARSSGRSAPPARVSDCASAADSFAPGATTIARCLPRIGPAGQRCAFEG